MTVSALVLLDFPPRVVALHRDTGEIVWTWHSPKGSGYVTLLLDGDRLIASVIGYTYCLDPQTGQQMWFNELPGLGTGVVSLASVRGIAGPLLSAASEMAEQSSQASVAATSTTI